jgi:hypothetical protein
MLNALRDARELKSACSSRGHTFGVAKCPHGRAAATPVAAAALPSPVISLGLGLGWAA